jgi:2-oxoglutarate ferredoxin oxidoreductase subunit gamma
MSACNILIAGFGGQGILFAGKFLAYTGLIQDKQVSWLPSYGPEMRGGTANCSVIISDTPVGSPIVAHPDLLIVMNLPSLDRYENECAANATVIIDDSLIPRELKRDDLKGFYVPATRLAIDENLEGLANMIMIGKAIRATGVCGRDEINVAMQKTVPARKKDLFDANVRAVELGYAWQEEAILRNS